MKSLSVVVTVFNEEKNLKACLESVEGLADEIIVVDNGSTDQTVAIAKQFTKHIYHQENDPSRIDLQKNLGFQKVTGEWVLSLDADERVSKELAEEIKGAIVQSTYTAYQMPRKNIIFNKWIEHSLWWPDYQIRLFQKGKAKFTNSTVHKQVEVEGTIGELKNPLIHENYQSLSQYLSKMDIYTTSEAESTIKEGKDFNWLDSVSLPVRDFLKTFFLQKGYQDGFHGLVLSCLQAFYTFLVIAKVWERKGFPEVSGKSFMKDLLTEWSHLMKEISYWIVTVGIETSGDFFTTVTKKVKRSYLTKRIRSTRRDSSE